MQVQDVTGARIQFKDDQNPDEDRICVIRGTEETAQKAEMIIRRMIAEEPPIVEEMITVPQRCVGRIIGKHLIAFGSACIGVTLRRD